MIIGESERLIFRDMISEDIEVRKYWEEIENEWQLWDGPWEYEGRSPEQVALDLENYLSYLKSHVEKVKGFEENRTRFSFQIVEKESGDYIGFINCYRIDEDYCYTEGDGYLTIGLDLPPKKLRGRGYGTEALCFALSYYKEKGYDTIYTQTWSGNERMIGLANKLGFKEIRRKKDFRLVRGERYDGLTFKKSLL